MAVGRRRTRRSRSRSRPRGAAGPEEPNMMKSLLLVAGGVGLALVAMLLRNAAENPPVAAGIAAAPAGDTARDVRSEAGRLAALESALTAEVERRTALEARVTSLTDELAALHAHPAVAASAA